MSGLTANVSDVETDIQLSRISKDDLVPRPQSRRKWGRLSFSALWISMLACIPNYLLASSHIGGGMNWWKAVLTIFLGNLIVLAPMIFNAHAGTKYGIPFPVYCRESFGRLDGNILAHMRAFVACELFGIQGWIGGNAIYKIFDVFKPPLVSGNPPPAPSISPVDADFIVEAFDAAFARL